MADTDAHAVEPPDELPAYVVGPLGRQSPDRLRSAAEWARELADAKEAEPDPEPDELANAGDEIVAVDDSDGGPTEVVKKVHCGKGDCSNCPHGPYRYLVRRDGERVVWDYRGAVDGGDA